jgi:hypothetical protein
VALIRHGDHPLLPGGVEGSRLGSGLNRLEDPGRHIRWKRLEQGHQQAGMAATTQGHLHQITGGKGEGGGIGVGEHLALPTGLNPDLGIGGWKVLHR